MAAKGERTQTQGRTIALASPGIRLAFATPALIVFALFFLLPLAVVLVPC